MSATRNAGVARCFVAALAYVLVTAGSLWLLRHPLADAGLAVRALVSLLPMLPIAFAVRAVVDLVLAGDELQRRIDLEAMAIAGMLVGLGSLTLSFLVIADVFEATGRQALTWIFPALWIAYGLARIVSARRYQ